MSDTEDETDRPVTSDIRVLVGDLRGRMRSHEQRMDRHETWVGSKFDAFEKKIDGIDSKLDDLGTFLAEQTGGKRMLKLLMQPALWAVGALGALASWGLAHLTMAFH